MKKQLAILVAGAVIGLISSRFFFPSTPASPFSGVLQPDIQNVPEISAAAAQAHRQDRYAAIRSIEDTLSLPSEFAESEALYVIAGRADSGKVQDLIQQAARIIDRRSRKAALSVLFLRLTELDPLSAIAIARTPSFVNIKSFEVAVWEAWGRLDLESALRAAADQGAGHRQMAAQSLYTSLPRLNTDEATLIETALDIRPGRKAIAHHVRALADESPAAAIKYIESSGTLTEQSQQLAMLATYLADIGASQASNYAQAIRWPGNRQMFEQILNSRGSLDDPEAALQLALSGPMDAQSTQRAYNALRQLAIQNAEKALEYLDQLPRSGIGNAYLMGAIGAIATSSPQEAIAWVRESDKSGRQRLLMGVLVAIAQNDPQLALGEAQSIENKTVRDQILSNIVMMAAHRDPLGAVSMLDQISDVSAHRSSTEQLAQTWVQSDLDGALDWIATLNDTDRQATLRSIGRTLSYTDVSRAIALLERFPDADTGQLKVQIVAGLVRTRSVEEAESFVARFEGTDEYLPLQMSVISNIANSDPAHAMRMARAIADVKDRDRLFASIVRQQAEHDPLQAMRWVGSISTSQSRRKATAQTARAWYEQDPAAATDWLQRLPRAKTRDAVIVAVVASSNQSLHETDALIATIGSTKQRTKARLAQLRHIMSTDLDEARRRLADIEVSQSERERYQRMIETYQYGY